MAPIAVLEVRNPKGYLLSKELWLNKKLEKFPDLDTEVSVQTTSKEP